MAAAAATATAAAVTAAAIIAMRPMAAIIAIYLAHAHNYIQHI